MSSEGALEGVSVEDVLVDVSIYVAICLSVWLAFNPNLAGPNPPGYPTRLSPPEKIVMPPSNTFNPVIRSELREGGGG